MRNDNGITLVALIVTIVILLIIIGISISSGTESADNTKIQGFYTQLEIIQKRVDDIAATDESYIDKDGNTVRIKDSGRDLTNEQQILLQSILNSENIDLETTSFKYFTVEDLESILSLSNIEYNVFINFDKRLVVAENGIEIDGKIYYILENSTYFVEQNINKNTGTIQSLIYNVTEYGEDKYKVVITTSNIIGDLNESGYVKYKKTTTKYWETSSNTEIIVELGVVYNIIYIDSNNNSLEKMIIVQLDSQNVPNVQEVIS